MNIFLEILQNALKSIKSLKSVDIFDNFVYEDINLPIANINNIEDEIQVSADDSWKHSISLKISAVSDNFKECFSLSQDILTTLKNIPKDTYMIQVLGIQEEDRTLESSFIRISISLKVEYYTRGYEL